jgi:arylsulfatase A-like enzyme
MRWTNTIPVQQEDHGIASMMDLLPTIAHATNTSIPEDLDLDGYNLMPRVLGMTTDEDRIYFYHALTSLHAVRKGPWKLILPRQKNAPELSWLGRYIDNVDEHQLYNLENDISETSNVAKQHPEVVADLIGRAKWASKHL